MTSLHKMSMCRFFNSIIIIISLLSAKHLVIGLRSRSALQTNRFQSASTKSHRRMVPDVHDTSDAIATIYTSLSESLMRNEIPDTTILSNLPGDVSELAHHSFSPLEGMLLSQSDQDSFASFNLAGASIDFNSILSKAASTGKAGALAAGIQVVSLMWLRTALNYQYRYGTSTTEALKTLWKEGGIARLYQGLPFALLQGPLSRFGDTAANALVANVLDILDPLGTVPVFLRTGIASGGAAVWRLVLLPIDAAKTSLQVNGEKGMEMLKKRVELEGPSSLFSGALAGCAATFVGHYPWFLTYNYLSDHLPTAQDAIASIHVFTSSTAVTVGRVLDLQGVDLDGLIVTPVLAHYPVDINQITSVLSHLLTNTEIDPTLFTIIRSAFIGLCASSISDICSNSLRVLKTTKQTAGIETVKDTPINDLSVSKTVQRNTNEIEIVTRMQNEVKAVIPGDNVKISNMVIEDAKNTKIEPKSYIEIAKDIIAVDGIGGLLGRGLQTRILANAIQGMLFSVLFKYFQSSSK